MLPTHPAARFRQRTAANVEFNEAQLGLHWETPMMVVHLTAVSQNFFLKKKSGRAISGRGGSEIALEISSAAEGER